MDALSLSRSSSSHTDPDVSMFMDTSQDFESSQGGIVRWVASQSPNPALQALMREAERDRRTRPSTPVDEPMSWTYPPASTTSSTSFSTSVSSTWHSSGHSLPDATYPPPLSGSSSSASSSSLAPRASEPSVSRRAQPLSAVPRRPLASSTSSTNQPPRYSTRPRSSSHSTAPSNPSTSKGTYTPQDDEPEAVNFIDLLKKMSRQVDENSKMKQQVVRAKAKGKERGESLEKSGADNINFTDLDASNSGARPLTRTTSADVVYPVRSAARAPEKTLISSLSAHRPEPRGRALAKEPSFGASGVDTIFGKSTPASLPSPNLNCDSKPIPAPRPPAGTSNAPSANHAFARKTSLSTLNDGDTTMQDVIELTNSDTDCEKPVSGPILRADTAMCMDLDDETSDTGMDVSFYKSEPPPRARMAVPPKPEPQPLQPTMVSRPLATTQRPRTGPPPLGMRRALQLQPSQYGSTQGSNSKSATAPRFKPPLLANAGGTMNKSQSRANPAMESSSRLSLRDGATKIQVAKASRATPKDPDSSFDISFDVDADALEETMKAYD